MISEIIDYINTFIIIPGAKIHGLAQLVIRKNHDNSEQLMPGLIHYLGEITYVGIDDSFPLRLYHINNSITVSFVNGVGDNRDTVNTFNNTMYVYYDRKKINLMPDDIYLYIQSVVPQSIPATIAAYTVLPFKKTFVKFSNVILKSIEVFASQYQGTGYRLHPEKHLFAINYTVESTLKTGCFDNPFNT